MCRNNIRACNERRHVAKRQGHAVLTVGLLLAALSSTAKGQVFHLSWYTIDGGGHTFSTGGGFELGGTIGQADAGPQPPMTGGSFELSGGFWPGVQAGGGQNCTGSEKINKAKCKQKRGSNTLTVKLKGGVANDPFTVKLSSGPSKEGVLNRKGKGSARFADVPSGRGAATTTWGCGAEKKKDYSCP